MRKGQHQQIRDLIEHMLDLATKDQTFKTSGEYLAYQRGFLTRFLMDLAYDDFYALQTLQKKIKALEEK